ncbi:type I-MYXAN CRISPR-associated Cas8a1/Cmx1 [Synechococcus sp. PCC 6312]|uniref:type I-MYXAN CRISPR-associated Cas8a1/Cmx1 n=1 Tax=Synechococcus sp. (strain ATCC 27167 / PCC 6312) TaxID=195253 RepID=UPI00029F0602|nr:type I-MYXAN CRISPR-associated Cas8a1/Cmx1 [Synechococcus sp. PCC 6312]AFY60376.1 CRISPR-associated protein Cas8a1/Csx13, MYXAN subtype [Synechococcus sp. PCC 6312]
MEIASIFPLTYCLSDPNYTIYHRAALGGLAATIEAWDKSPPQGITPKLDHDFVIIEKTGDLTDQEAFKLILDASFKLTEDKLIDLPGQFIREDAIDLRISIHEGLCLTFLQHNKMRPGEKEPYKFPLKLADSDENQLITYKAINSFAHQKAQGTGLLGDSPKNKDSGRLPQFASIPQSMIPGAMTGRKSLQAPVKEVILLHFLMVGCVTFLLRPRTYKEKAQACIVIPDIIDLVGFTGAIKRISSRSQNFERFTHTYLGRVVGGAEEAAFSFLLDMTTHKIEREKSIKGCQAIAMGKVAWDKNQINRSISVKVGGDYEELGVFRAAKQYLGKSKFIKLRDGKSFSVPDTAIPELIAANLAANRHWCGHFKELLAKKEDFHNLLFKKGGLHKVSQAIKSKEDIAIIRAFHKAWEMTMAQMGKRARDNNLDFGRLVEVRQEKIRNEILRLKTSDAVANWFLKFCADATKGGSLAPIREDAELIRDFIFNRRNFDRLQNLLLFALVSYESDKSNN